MKRAPVLTLLVVFAIAVIVAATALPWDQYPVFNRVLETAERSLARPLLQLGQVPITPAFLIKTTVFLLLLAFVARKSRRLFRHYILDRLAMEEGHKYALETATEYLIVIAGLAIGLESAGVNLSTLALLGGALGIGVGFGLQPIVNNFVSGLVLLFEGPVKVGDRVEIAQLNGDVVKIGARSTWVRTNDNIIVVMPNSEFIVKPVINWTATDRQVRFSLSVGVGYGSDPGQVRDLLLDVARQNRNVLSTPSPDVIFTEFGDSSLNFDLRYWTIAQVQTPKILKSDLYFAIFRTFKEHGIEIPFPQRDLHLRKRFRRCAAPPGSGRRPTRIARNNDLALAGFFSIRKTPPRANIEAVPFEKHYGAFLVESLARHAGWILAPPSHQAVRTLISGANDCRSFTRRNKRRHPPKAATGTCFATESTQFAPLCARLEDDQAGRRLPISPTLAPFHRPVGLARRVSDRTIRDRLLFSRAPSARGFFATRWRKTPITHLLSVL